MKPQKKIRGRPVDPKIQKQKKMALINAAHYLLQHKSYHSINIREIADAADMKSAMISYYFGNKEALFIALLEHAAEQQFEVFRKTQHTDNPLKEFIYSAVQFFSQNKAITRLIADEVLFQQSALGKRFIELFPKKIAVFLPDLIISHPQYKTTINAQWAAFSLMTMLVMPFIGDSVRRHAWGISDQLVCSKLWSEHIYQLFTHGILDEESNHA
jgi:AcrR family transcriptional regulator